MEKKLLAVCAAVALAGSAGAAPLASESFSNLTATNSGTGVTSATPGFTLPGAPDIDAAGQFNSSYEYGGPYLGLVNDDAQDFPGAASDNKFLTIAGNTDEFFRVYANTAIANSSPNLKAAWAFQITGRSATAADNDVDMWRFMDITRTGSGASIGMVQVVDGDILLSTNGLGGTLVGNISSLTDNTWYVMVLEYNRAGGAAGTASCYAIDATTGAKTTFTPLTGLTAGNLNEVATLATGATLDVPSGTSAFTLKYDTVSIFDSSVASVALEADVRASFGLPSSVNDWTAY